MRFIENTKPIIPKRDKNSHKGTFGTSLIIAGSYGMAGAAVLAANAALRSGVGKAKLAVNKSIYGICAAAISEAVFIPYGICFKNKLIPHIKTANSILFGCGCSTNKTTLKKLKFIIKNANCPIVIDADGINVLSQNIDILKQAKTPIILTPHPLEMSRLSGKGVQEIGEDRICAATEFANKYGVYVVLKGNGTVIAAPNETPIVNPTGNPGMATGGSGDVLAGIMAGLLAQQSDILKTVSAAVYIHGMAGDVAADNLGETAILPSDIIEELPCVFKTLEG